VKDRQEMQRLEAYRDGELSGFARWRVERRLRRDPAARRALAELEALGAFLREADAAAPAGDLWESIRMRLPAADARLAEAEAARSAAPSWRRPAGYLALGAAAAGAVALALVVSLDPPPAPSGAPSGSVRWIDARGHPMMVLRDDAGATIIWVAESEI
jgi:anti-sigma factor RsiW